MTHAERCGIPGCEKPAAASLDARPLCPEHFISTCHTQLEAYTELQKERRLGEISVDSLRQFIRDCVRGADSVEQDARHLDNLERARLLDIILSAADLGRYLRRSPRKVACIPIQVRSKKPRELWQEDTETRVISRYGALAQCEHSLEIDETLRVIRIDSGRAADARVAWCQRKSEGQRDIGIEFLDCDNFWGLDWDVVERSV